MQDNPDIDLLTAVERLLRKVYLMYQAHRWSKEAQRALHYMDYHAAEIALDKYNELNDRINDMN